MHYLEINGWEKWKVSSLSLFGFHVLRVKLVYDDKDPSRDKSPPGSGGKWERNFYDNGFRPEHAEQIYKAIRFELKMEFMTVVEISFPFYFPLFYDLAFSWPVYALFVRFIDANLQLHGTMIASINALNFLRLQTPKK